MKFLLQHRQLLENVPSASGIALLNEILYVVGDNSAWLYELNRSYDVTSKQLLMQGITNHLIPKASKPDFEAMTNIEIHGKSELLIFGSGSKSPERNTMARIQFLDQIQSTIHDLSKFYQALTLTEHMEGQELNIEAAATVADNLYLFNREHNIMWQIPLAAFLKYVEGTGALPPIFTHRLILPKHDKLQVKISGASTIIGTNQLVYVASIEDAPNTYDDGEVLGSYVGLIDLNLLKNEYQPDCIAILDDVEPLLIKVESVEVLKIVGSQTIKLVMVTDSDGGDSELLVGELDW